MSDPAWDFTDKEWAVMAQEAAPDAALATLVATINRMPGASIGVTLTVQGVIVHGDLISGRTYWERLADELSAAGGGTASGGDALATHWARPMTGVYDEAEPDGEVERPTIISHLHLARARLVTGPIATHDVGLWRGRLAAVSGWALGRPTS